MQLTSIIHHLNDQQKEAVTAPPGHLLVLAGAGSGKTRVLVHRIAYLMEAYPIAADEILAVTFTNKAAAEMRSRIEALCHSSIQPMWTGTFHGLSHRLLRAHWADAKLPQTFQIIDNDDQLRLVKRIHRAMNLEEKIWPPKKSQWFINHHKENSCRANQVLFSEQDYIKEKLQKVYREYELVCERSGLVDFAELILRTVELLTNNDAIRQYYQKRFKHILVDEFQDTNTIQYRWLKLFSGNNTYFMAVGDDDQSIYSWRGAEIENIRQFSRDFKDSKLIRLEQNYRSTKNILNAANAMIHHNEKRLGKTLWTMSESGDPIFLFQALNEYEEAQYIVLEIKRLLQKNFSLRDFAILYRSNAQSRVLEECFMMEKLPYRVYGGFKFFERAEIKDALAYLRLITNRHDDAAFERIVNVPARGIGQTTLSKLREWANKNKTSLWGAAQYCFAHDVFAKHTSESLQLFTQLIERLVIEIQSLKLTVLVDHVLHRVGLFDFYKQNHTEKEISKIDNLKEFVSATADFLPTIEHEHISILEAFLSTVMLNTNESAVDQHADAVNMMTLHAAKGLEFSIVFMTGLEENLFPNALSIAEHGLEEERRLCYVGMTRAMKKLFLTCAKSRYVHGNKISAQPSRFLREVPENLLQRIRPTLMTNPAHTKFITKNQVKSSLDSHQGFSIGQSIVHKKFGMGVITDYEGQGQSARIQVKFEKHGMKWLVLQYANSMVDVRNSR